MYISTTSLLDVVILLPEIQMKKRQETDKQPSLLKQIFKEHSQLMNQILYI